MSISSIRSIATLMAAALLSVVGSYATTITTTSTGTWEGSAYIMGGHYSTLNFYPVLQSSYNTASGISLTPAQATTSFDFTGLDNGSYYLAGDVYNKTLASSVDTGSYIKIAFTSAAQNAILLGTTATISHPLTLSLSDGESFTVISPVFGLSASHSFSWATLAAAGGSQATVSDFWFAASSLPQDAPVNGMPAPTPEPATILLSCAGGVLMIFGASKQARSSAA